MQKEATKQNEDTINLQPKNTYKTNQKLNSNRREGIRPILRDVRMMGIRCLRKNKIELIKHLKIIIHTNQVSEPKKNLLTQRLPKYLGYRTSHE